MSDSTATVQVDAIAFDLLFLSVFSIVAMTAATLLFKRTL